MIIKTEKDIIETVYDIVNTRKDPQSFYPNTYANYRNVYKCNEMKKKYEEQNNFVYDVVIRTRPDVFYSQQIPLNDLRLNFLTMNDHYVNDLCFISTSKILDIVSSIFLNIDPNSHMNPHVMLENHISKNGITIDKINMKIELVKQNGEIIKYC